MKAKSIVFVFVTLAVIRVSGVEEEFPTELMIGVISDLQETFHAGCLVFTTGDTSTLEHERKTMQCGKMVSKTEGRMVTLQVKSQDKMEGDGFQCRKNRPLVVILDLRLLSRNIRQMPSYARWVIFTYKMLDIDKILKRIYIPIDCEFVLAEQTGEEVFLTEIYQISEHGPLIKAHFGRWNPTQGLNTTSKSLYERRKHLHGVVLKAAVVSSPPAITFEMEGKQVVNVSGYFGDLWRLLEKRLHFTTEYYLSIDGQYGKKLANGSFSGMIGMLERNSVDVGVGEYSITTNRFDVIDFLHPTLFARLQILIRQPDSDTVEWQNFLSPFDTKLWMTFLATAFIIALTLTLFQSIGYRWNSDSNRKMDIADSLYQVHGLFCQQGQHETPTSTSSRMVYITACMISIVLLGSYSGALISSLANQVIELPFENLQGFADDGTYELGFYEMTATTFELFATNPNDPLFGPLLRNFFHGTNDNITPIYDEKSLARICSNKIAFLSTNVYILEKLKHLPCKVVWLPEKLSEQSMALAISKKSSYIGILNKDLQILKEIGILKRLMERYWPISSTTPQIALIEVGYQQVVPILAIFTLGIVASCLVLCCEYVYRRVSLKRGSRACINHVALRIRDVCYKTQETSRTTT